MDDVSQMAIPWGVLMFGWMQVPYAYQLLLLITHLLRRVKLTVFLPCARADVFEHDHYEP